MDLTDYCDFISQVMKVRVICPERLEDLEGFCSEARFHSVQHHLYPEELESLLDGVMECEIVRIIDAIQTRLVLTRILDRPVILGPFCSESFSTEEAQVVLDKAGMEKTMANELLVYRSRCPFLLEKDVVHVIHVLMNKLLGITEFTDVRKLDFTSPSVQSDSVVDLTPHAVQIAERYAIETRFMENIENGDAHEAVKNWQKLHRRVDYLRRMYGHSLDGARESATGSRTVIRVAGMRAGIEPHILDELTKQARENNRKARSIDEISASTEALIWAICREARRVKSKDESRLTASVKFFLNSHYKDEVSISAIADELGVSESSLIRSFRTDTGTTPGAWLYSMRIRKATELLETTRWTVQRIGSEVGIRDSNYFIKLFKKAKGVTPLVYRKNLVKRSSSVNTLHGKGK